MNLNRWIWLFILCIVAHPAHADPNAAQKIIALSPHAVEMLYAIGAGDRIIATVEYADYPKAALQIPRIGNYNGVQIERIVALQPDLIVAWPTGNKQSDLQKLESLGFRILYSLPKNAAQISEDLIRLGKLTGLEANAQKIAEQHLQRLHNLQQRYANQRAVKVFYQISADPLRTVGPDSWAQTLLTDCNAQNIFANGISSDYPMVSLESVIQKNPDVIIIADDSKTESNHQEYWNHWSEIQAVKRHHVIAVNTDLLHRFTPRLMDGLEMLCQAIDQAR